MNLTFHFLRSLTFYFFPSEFDTAPSSKFDTAPYLVEYQILNQIVQLMK